jgi:hypothetical protein
LASGLTSNTLSQTIGKSNNFNVFGSNKTKRSKQDNQNRLRLSMPEG